MGPLRRASLARPDWCCRRRLITIRTVLQARLEVVAGADQTPAQLLRLRDVTVELGQFPLDLSDQIVETQAMLLGLRQFPTTLLFSSE